MNAKIYKFVDQDNVTHFSDFYDEELAQNFTEINLSDDNDNFRDQVDNENAPISLKQSTSFNYNLLTIDYPQNNETVFFDANGLTLKYHIEPSLRKGDKLVFLLDNKEDTNVLQNVVRGEHKLQIKIYSSEGKEVASSEMITFFMRQNSIL